MKVTLARLILFHMEQGKTHTHTHPYNYAHKEDRIFFFSLFSGQSAEAASDSALAYMKSRVEGRGGVVTVDSQGRWAARFSSAQMSWAAVQEDTLHYGVYAGEHMTQNINTPTDIV